MTTTTVTVKDEVRPLRVDAERRRQALLCTAAAVFLDEGIDAPLESVARAAGVGIATLYRRFPSRDALVEAVFEAKMARYADRAEQAADAAESEVWGAFSAYVGEISAMQAADPGFGAVLIRPMRGSALFADAHGRAARAAQRLVERARDGGAVREDVRVSDLYLLAAATAALVAEPGPLPAADAARRLTDLFLDAVRGPHA